MFYSKPLCILLFIRVPWLCCFAFIHVPKRAQFSSVRFVRSLALTHSFSADSVVLSTSTIFHWCMWLKFFPLISRMLFTLARPGFSLAVVCDVFEQQTEAAYVTKGTFVKCLWVGSLRTQTQRLEWTHRDWALEHDIRFIQFSNWGERIHLMGKQSKRLIHLRAFYWQKKMHECDWWKNSMVFQCMCWCWAGQRERAHVQAPYISFLGFDEPRTSRLPQPGALGP